MRTTSEDACDSGDKEPDAVVPMDLRNIAKKGAEVGAVATMALGTYEVVKWGVAAFLAPETGGASIGGALATP